MPEEALEPLSLRIRSIASGSFQMENLIAPEGFDFREVPVGKTLEDVRLQDLVCVKIRALVEAVYLVHSKKLDTYTLEDLFLVTRMTQRAREDIQLVLVNIAGKRRTVQTIADDVRDFTRVSDDLVIRAKVEQVKADMENGGSIVANTVVSFRHEGETFEASTERLLRTGQIKQQVGAFP